MSTETHRFFRSTPEVYEATRAAIDAVRGYPSGRAETAFPPIAQAVIDSEGRALLAVDVATLEEPEIAAILPGLLASGLEEITRADYFAALPSEPEI